MEYCVGDTHHIWMIPGGKYKIHILAIVDDEYVVYKWYGKRKQWWHYVVEHENILSAYIKLVKEMENDNAQL